MRGIIASTADMSAPVAFELPDPPTAVFACNDLMAVGAPSALEDRGLRAPDDVVVVGYDDITIASVTRPKLTTVAQPSTRWARLALMLIERLKNPGASPTKAWYWPLSLLSGNQVWL